MANQAMKYPLEIENGAFEEISDTDARAQRFRVAVNSFGHLNNPQQDSRMYLLYNQSVPNSATSKVANVLINEVAKRLNEEIVELVFQTSDKGLIVKLQLDGELITVTQ